MLRGLANRLRSIRQRFNILRNPTRYFLVHPPGHFYSPLPSIDDIDPAVNSASRTDDLPGINLRTQDQLTLLKELAPLVREWSFSDHAVEGQRYYAYNDYFYPADGSILYALLRGSPPKLVIEVGSGFSSALMLDTVDRHFDMPVDFTFIDPYPERLLTVLTANDHSHCRILTKLVQQVSLDIFDQLSSGDILFIDSSHVCKIGSDVNHLVFNILPRLAVGVRVHIHDIYWPFTYPEEQLRRGWAWNEAFLIRAFLQFNHHYQILLWPSYLNSQRQREFHDIWPYATDTAGSAHSSLWLEKVG